MEKLELKYGCNPNQKPAQIYMRDGGKLPVVVLNGNCDDFNAPWPLAAFVVEFWTTKVVAPPEDGASNALVALSITTICDTLGLPAGG